MAASLSVMLALPSCDRAKDLIGSIKPPASKKTAPASSGGSAVVQDLDSSGYEAFVATPGKLMVVDFHAGWCGPCRVLGPVLEQVAGEFEGKVGIGKVDVDQSRDLAQRHGVRSIPDVRLFLDGKEVDRFVGALDATRVRALFEKHTDGIETRAPGGSEPGAQATVQVEPMIQPMKKDWLPPGIERR